MVATAGVSPGLIVGIYLLCFMVATAGVSPGLLGSIYFVLWWLRQEFLLD